MPNPTFEERKKKPLPASSKPAPKAPSPTHEAGEGSKSAHDIGKVGMTSSSAPRARSENKKFEGALDRAGKEDPEDVVDRSLAAGSEKEDKEILERIMQGPKMDVDAYTKRIQEENFQAFMRGERNMADRVAMGEYAEEDRKAMDRVMSARDPKEDQAALDRVMAQYNPKESAAALDRVMQDLDYPRQLSMKEKSALQKIIADGVVPLTPEQKITGDEYADTAAIAEYFLSQKSAENALSTTEEAHPLSHDPLFGLSSEHTRNSPVFEVYRKDTVLSQYKRFYKKIQPPKELKTK